MSSKASELKVGERIAGLVEWTDGGGDGTYQEVRLHGHQGESFFIDPEVQLEEEQLIVLEKKESCPCDMNCGNVGWEVVESDG